MATYQVTELVKLLKWLVPRKFCFVLSLKTGIQFYSLSSFIFGVLISDMLLVKMIELEPYECRGYRSAADLFSCSEMVKVHTGLNITGIDELRTFVSKQIILLHISLSFISAMLLYFLKWPTLPLYWSGGKLIVATTGICYLPEWIRVILLEFFNWHVHSFWIAVVFTVMDIYGILVALGYYSELVGGNSTISVSNTNNDMPLLPDVDIVLSPLSN